MISLICPSPVGGISGSRSGVGGFYASLGNALGEAAPDHFANANPWLLIGETALFSAGVVLGGWAIGAAALPSGMALYGAAGATAGFAGGLVQTYVGDAKAGLGSYALGGGVGWAFGGMNPFGAATGLVGTLGGAAVGGNRGAQIGGLVGDLVGAGLDDVVRAVAKGANLGRAAMHAFGQTAVTGSVVGGVGLGTYYATGNADTALFAANLAMLPANLIGRAVVPCFPAGTPILTPDGYRPIEELKADDLVISRSEFDDGTGPVSPKRIEEVFVREGRIIRLTVAGHSLLVTPEHPFYVKNDGWIPAGQLKAGDLLSTPENQWIPVDSIEETGEWTTVYNFRVADYHTYFAALKDADTAVWVHNAYNAWNAFQNATKGQFTSRAEAAAVWKAWDKGTFPSKLESILYHYGKHGNGRTLGQYTSDALAFWSTNKASATWGIWNPKWSPSYRLKIPPQGGYFTGSGNILTYWD